MLTYSDSTFDLARKLGTINAKNMFDGTELDYARMFNHKVVIVFTIELPEKISGLLCKLEPSKGLADCKKEEICRMMQ